MTIAIDCRHIDSSGVGVYLRGCLPYFLSSPNTFFLIGSSQKIKPHTADYTNFSIIDCPIRPFSVKELLFFPSRIRRAINHSDLYYSPFFNVPSFIAVPVFTTIHDIVFPDMPELTSPLGLLVRMFFYKRAYRRSKIVFTVSNFSKSRIEYHLGTKKPVIVTYDALLPYLRESAIRPKKTKTILFVGNIKKHKDLSTLMEAFFNARGEGLTHKLVIVGNKDNFRSFDGAADAKIKESGGNAVEFTGFITDGELRNLLAGAALLVQPSLYEGFGIPPLEAMALGTRVLISDIPVFKEIYAGFPVTYFRAADAADLKEKMLKLLNMGNYQPLILPDHLLNKYTFNKTASVIIHAFAGESGIKP